jgi:hypothetical protein
MLVTSKNNNNNQNHLSIKRSSNETNHVVQTQKLQMNLNQQLWKKTPTPPHLMHLPPKIIPFKRLIKSSQPISLIPLSTNGDQT